jgi:hypothetical protein
MAAQANVTLNTKVYVPIGIADNVAKWRESSAAYPQGYSILSLSLRPPSPGSKNYRAVSKLLVPVVQAEDSGFAPAGTFLRQSAFEVTATLDSTLSAAERLDSWTRFKEWVANAQFEDAFSNLVPPTSA